MTLTDSMKKKLKIGAIVLGVGALGFGIYKMTKKPKATATSASTALSGVRRRRKKTTKTKTKAKTKLLN